MRILLLLLPVLSAHSGSAMAQGDGSQRLQVERITLNWSKRARLGAVETMAKYGPPQEITAERLIWHDAGPFIRITAHGFVLPHDFPMPHLDYLEHTISYHVPLDRIEEVLSFDGSLTISRTAGELSARCNLEAHNVAALNLAHEIIEGRKSVAQAREAFADIVRQEISGVQPRYGQRLRFETHRVRAARTTDSPQITGAPVNAADIDPRARAQLRANAGSRDDAEALATLIAFDMNQVRAARVAREKNLHPEVATFVRSLHEDHGRNIFVSMSVGERIGVTPADTRSVIRLKERGAAEIAELVPLNAARFEGGFLKTVIEAQAASLREIDDMASETRDEVLRVHLGATRQLVAAHRDRALELQREVATSPL